jgi:hypothetical protein
MDFLGLRWDTFLGMPSYVWAGIIASIAVPLMAKMGNIAARRRNGWNLLEPGIALYLFIPVQLIMVLLFTTTTVVSGVLIFSQPNDRITLSLLILSPPIAYMMWYSLWYLLFVRIHFNETGVERRNLFRHTFIAWKDIAKIRRHWFFGPQIVTVQGRKYGVWEYLRGFRDFIDTAKTQGVTVAI